MEYITLFYLKLAFLCDLVSVEYLGTGINRSRNKLVFFFHLKGKFTILQDEYKIFDKYKT